VLLENGIWKEAGKLQIGDLVQRLSILCAYCQKPVLKGKYCNNSCSTRGEEKWKPANIEVRKRVLDGTFILQQPEIRNLGNQSLGRLNYGGSRLEQKIKIALEQLGLTPEEQYRIPKVKRDSLDRQRYWFVDFAFPELKIAIECDEKYWHNNPDRTSRRQLEIEAQGWTILRFTSNEIKDSPMKCAEIVARRAANHAHSFMFNGFAIIDIEIKQPSIGTAGDGFYHTYNLSVAQADRDWET